ncbi:post-GPI attachment to proteins factor 6 [Diorhabda carinulata]|uniref:post-GPI attachment to proteins factor 6 n=1 Tax=Diorhabda carinulata TaxID=1163345 RepID=UPI0025A1E674|nr:post-GPI attachment to proteins factor 6 [Diorhabda carinulata]
MGMTDKYIVYSILAIFINQTASSNVTITSRTVTSYLEQYKSYKDIIMIHLKIPQNTLFASFKFTADETRMSIFPCKTRNVSLYMKYGAPPVVNPDGSPFPKAFKNVTRYPTYNTEIQTNKKEKFINITSPDPGSYFVIAFLAYQDPKYNAISQQGLRADCYSNVEASLFVNKIDNPLIVTHESMSQLIAHPSESRYFKFYVPSPNDQGILYIQNIIFPDNVNKLLVRLEVNKPPSEEVHHKQEIIYSNTTHSRVFFSTSSDSWHYIEYKFEGENDETTSGNFTFQIKFISNELPEESTYYESLQNETYFNNSFSKTFHNYRITDLVPYKQYELIREATSETFLFSFELEQELESKVAIPINMTSSHFSLMTFKIREGTDVGGTLQFILAFKPRTLKNKKFGFINEPENHVVVACIRRGGIEVPTWPNKCIYNSIESSSQLILNKTTENSTILIPYPESGIWYATFKLFCGECVPCRCPESCQKQYEQCVIDCELSCPESEDCKKCTTNCSNYIIEIYECKGCDCEGPCLKDKNSTCNTSLIFDIGSHACIFGQCSRNGRCIFVVSDGVVFSTCSCMNKYRGWDCSDNTQATPYYMVVIELLLLVFSNLMFLPAVYVAFKRKYYIEGVTYFFICFFSTFYHACDAGENLLNFCLVRLSALQFGDFFCAILAIWVTLLAIADLPQLFTSMCHMVGAIILAFCTTINKTSLWVFALPVFTGLIIIAISWFMKYRKVEQRFANRRYLFYQIPIGVTLVVVGLVCYAFLQTEDNYKYLHSFWHILMAVALIIILPKPNTFLPEVIL